MALVIGGGIAIAQAPADEVARHEALARRAKARLEALHMEADALAAKAGSLLSDLRRLELQRQARTVELAQSEAEHAAALADLADTSARIADLEGRLAADRPAVEARLVRLYKQGALDAPQRWMGVTRVEDLAYAHRTLSALARLDRDRLAAHGAELDQLAAARIRLDARANEAAAARARAETARAEAARAAGAHAALLASIDRRRDLTAQLAGELQQAEARLHTELADLATGEPGATSVLPIRPFQGTIDWPAPGRVSGQFGRERRAYGTGIVRNGLEIACAEGTPVTAVHEGRVAFADAFSGFGRLVIVEHGHGAFSLYGYLDTIDVARGTRVDAGTVIGASGRAPGGAPSLYFELRIDGRPVDPLQWLKRR
jgi:septal ring factor EnvC (AmiA/AmiB activator)